MFALVAVDPWGEEIGRVSVARKPYARFSDILGIEVDKSIRRRRVGTALYEAAAAQSCAKFKAPLGSADVRSPMADQFWRKQYVKQRAHCTRWIAKKGHGIDAGKRWCEHYVLSCPAPGDLSGQ